MITLFWLCLENHPVFINSKICKAQFDTLPGISTIKMIYIPAYDGEQQGLEAVLHTAHDSRSMGFMQRLQFIEASSTHANMSFSLTLQTSDETNGPEWSFPLVPAEGSVAQQSTPIRLFKVNQLE